MEAMLLYGVLPELDIITSVYVRNQSSEKIYVNKVMSAELDFLYGDYDLFTLRKTCHGAESAESTGGSWKSDDRQCRGTSSHGIIDDDPGRERTQQRIMEAAMLCPLYTVGISG